MYLEDDAQLFLNNMGLKAMTIAIHVNIAACEVELKESLNCPVLGVDAKVAKITKLNNRLNDFSVNQHIVPVCPEVG
ncbi:MAG: hypothetical protein AB7D06_18190 [Pedobacter sp.]